MKSCRRFFGIVSIAIATLFLASNFALAQRGQPQAAPEKIVKKFDFGPGKVQDGYIQVKPDTVYTKELGYGIDLGTKAEGFENGSDPLTGNFLTSSSPFYFSAALPEGTYRVTVTLGDPKGESETTIKAEAHRLMVEDVKTAAGKFEKRSFLVNTRTIAMTPPIPNSAPGRPEVSLGVIERRDGGGLTWDNKLTLEFLNSRPCVSAVEIESVPDAITVFIAGDSTVTDQPGNAPQSWGQMLTNFFKSDIVVANYAESGETMKSSITELRLDKLLGNMKKGDYFLIQYGHNDSKANWPQTYVAADSTYRDYLKVYIGEARRRGAIPVIISPMERRNNGTTNSHGGYPDAVAAVAKETGCAYIDLHTMSQKMAQAMGENFGALFNDGTHHSRFGAYELAKCIAQGIKDNKLDLASHLSDDFKGFDPTKPDAADQFKVPQSANGTIRPPSTIAGS